MQKKIAIYKRTMLWDLSLIEALLLLVKIGFVLHFFILWRAWAKLDSQNKTIPPDENWKVPTISQLEELAHQGDPLADGILLQVSANRALADEFRN